MAYMHGYATEARCRTLSGSKYAANTPSWVPVSSSHRSAAIATSCSHKIRAYGAGETWVSGVGAAAHYSCRRFWDVAFRESRNFGGIGERLGDVGQHSCAVPVVSRGRALGAVASAGRFGNSSGTQQRVDGFSLGTHKSERQSSQSAR